MFGEISPNSAGASASASPHDPDGKQAFEAAEQELAARRSLREHSGQALLKNLPAAQAPSGPLALAEVFRPPHDLPTEAQVEAFLAETLQQGAISQDMADEIRFYEALERSRTVPAMLPQDLLKHLRGAPLSSPQAIAHLYGRMSAPAASACMSTRQYLLHAGIIGQREKDGILKNMVLRILDGQDAACTAPAARHTLAHVLTERMAQIHAMPGGDRLSMNELAERVVFGVRGQR
ncbi:hypothetical protein GT347_18280 [Xylophilus rhododendri]|uniref:Uncharacterized protein n=1 Tax=Xylophilus rhododendri TaxID=2697032 RepID=A0A857J956_9BURK|nr:hypothetical protein [Xylophilus rhododendri]QHI99753.1 hypothetical protein GT347_18280 [Xylophilus rhododendri]